MLKYISMSINTDRITSSSNFISSIMLALNQLCSKFIQKFYLLFLSRKRLLKVIKFLQQSLDTVQRITEVFIGKKCLQSQIC